VPGSRQQLEAGPRDQRQVPRGLAGAHHVDGGVLVTPLVGLGPEGSPVPMALVVAGGALAALLSTLLLTRSRATAPVPEPSATPAA
jgi:hypothetical protein